MIRISGLTKRRDGQEVLRSIDLEVAKGDIAAIVGPSGRSKEPPGAGGAAFSAAAPRAGGLLLANATRNLETYS